MKDPGNEKKVIVSEEGWFGQPIYYSTLLYEIIRCIGSCSKYEIFNL